MHSLENRINSYKAWMQSEECTPNTLSMSGLYAEKGHLTTKCFFCSLTLKEWSSSDIPTKVHFNFSPKCCIFNLSKIQSRKKTFIKEIWPHSLDLAEKLSSQNFFLFIIKNEIPDEIFCYKCGYNTCELKNTENLVHALEHKKVCPVKSKQQLFTLKNNSPLFYVNLFQGKYISAFISFIESEIFIPNEHKEKYKRLLQYGQCYNIFDNVDTCLESALHCLVQSYEERLDKLIEEQIKSLQNFIGVSRKK
ncbi:hypothetical protein CWI38_1071p0020 [Hamiltosporidium tvaerminnensis]|uniref:Uncharacterized protein n=2 Tax=Hamiltosporidium TaxID=1176354 RepID=A0A4Q9LML7_9MICR|nr:hypothetical protein CWI39_0055p0010 [Hamiltosporidium magnivora]TBU11713.1 hypothetical protein CWI38_1071p0020 [Hamiltosporidium tvaerminnensis]